MPRTNPDLIQQIKKLQSEVRALRTMNRVYSDTKTFVVAGGVEVGMLIPPFIVSMTPKHAATQPVASRDPMEYKRLLGVCARVVDGSCFLNFTVNDYTINDTPYHAVATGPTHWEYSLLYNPPGDFRADLHLEDRDILAVEIVSATGAFHLSASFLMEITPGRRG